MIRVRPPVADLLSEPDPRAERVSQLLCFTPCEVLEEVNEYVRVRGPDGYEGWIRKSHTAAGETSHPRFKISRPVVPVVDPGTGEVIFRLCLDTRFPGEPTGDGVRILLPDGEPGLIPEEAVKPTSWRGSIGDLIELGLALRGVPYLWGGTSTFGFDCSGLVQRLFHFVFNIWLPRDSREQVEAGEAVRALVELRKGDLVFFPGHVGIWLGKGKILHASATVGMVTVSSLPGDPVALRRPIPLGADRSPRIPGPRPPRSGPPASPEP